MSTQTLSHSDTRINTRTVIIMLDWRGQVDYLSLLYQDVRSDIKVVLVSTLIIND